MYLLLLAEITTSRPLQSRTNSLPLLARIIKPAASDGPLKVGKVLARASDKTVLNKVERNISLINH
jgi:hypothetical protein